MRMGAVRPRRARLHRGVATQLLVLVALGAALGTTSGCGGAQRIDRIDVPTESRWIVSAGHHVWVTRDASGTRVRSVDRDGGVVAETAMPPESYETVAANDQYLVDRIAGRVRGRRHGETGSRWTWPQQGRAVDHALRGGDVLALAADGRLCLLEAGLGRALDCVLLPAAAGVDPSRGADGIQLLGSGRVGGTPWAWLRGTSAVVAIALNGACGASPCAGRPDGVAWSLGYAPDLPAPLLMGDALWLQPAGGVLELRDGRTGALRRTELAPRFGTLWPLAGVLVVAGVRDDGLPLVAALSPLDGAIRWQRGWTGGAPPLRGAEGPGVVRMFAADGAETVLRATDGALLGTLPPSTSAVANEESWIGQLPGGRVAVSPLAPRDSAVPPQVGATPAWFRTGTELHYLVHARGEPPRRLVIRIDEVSASGVRLRFAAPDGASRAQIWDLAQLEASVSLCVAPRPGDTATAGCPMLLLGRSVMRQLAARETVAVAWPGRGARPARKGGDGLHAASFRDATTTTPQLRLLPSVRLQGQQGDALLEVAAWPRLPLLLHAESPEMQVTFIGAAVAGATGRITASASATGAP